MSLILAAALLAPASASAAPPAIVSTSASQITTEAATVHALIDPQGKATSYRFEYGLAECATNPCTSIPVPDGTVPTQVQGAGTLTKGSGEVTNLSTNLGAFAPGQSVKGTGIEAGTTITAVTATTLTLSKAATQSGPATLTATGPQPVSATLEGLTPRTTYHLRLLATHKSEAGGEVKGPDTPFATFAIPQVFEPCPGNEAFRAGLASAALPDCRAYEQATPVDKDAGDATGTVSFVRSSLSGDAISFLTVSGMPGAKGAQEFPPYLANRGPGGWSTAGLLPPATTGQQAAVLGWDPEFSSVFSKATQLGEPPQTTFLESPGAGGKPTAITPYLNALSPDFAGSSAGSSEVLFESDVAIPGIAGAIEGRSNLYLWDKASEELFLADVMNEGQAPSRGAFAGPYAWINGTTPQTLARGGAKERYYLQDTHVLAADGTAVFFTAVGTGQLYERINPTQPQSALDGEGSCTEAAKACTIRISASKRTVPDPAGDRPAAFMAASTDGSKALFTSSQMLTNDANTGPEQSAAAIERADKETGGGLVPDVLATHAAGIATDSEHLYWINAETGAIGRSELDGSQPDPEFITATDNPKGLAVSGGFIYWANAAKEEGEGTIGKAELNGSGAASEVDQSFIEEAGNPKGVAVDAEHVYWTNDHFAGQQGREGTIGRANAADGSEANAEFFVLPALGPATLSGIAVDGEHIYWINSYHFTEVDRVSHISRLKLDGSEASYTFNFIFLGENVGGRDLASDGSHIYWAEQASGTVGRAKLNGEGEASEVEPGFIEDANHPIGLALQGSQLYWSANGESQPNPGNDLYQYDNKAKALSDLVPVSAGDGIEVKGVLGASADASVVYFVANGVPDGVTDSPNARGEEAEPGDCEGILGTTASGVCNLYRYEGGEVRFIARLDSGGGENATDGEDWTPTPQGIFPTTNFQRTTRVSADGQELLFRSHRQLSGYPNEGTSEFYLYRADTGTLSCVSCNPTGEPPTGVPDLGRITTPVVIPTPTASLLSHNLSAEGTRVFFETTDALVPADTNGVGGCPLAGTVLQKFPACTDVYEWEAVGTGSCKAADENADGGCVYLISTGKGDDPQLLADASASGDDVFFFTRSRLVGQDTDGLQDIYDARVGGGLAGQYPTAAEICPSANSCQRPPTEPPTVPAPPHLVGPGNPARKSCPKGKRLVGERCVRKHHQKHHKHRRGAAR